MIHFRQKLSKQMPQNFIKLLLFVVLWMGFKQEVEAQTVENQIDELLLAKPNVNKPYLPDFSYAGYYNGEKAIPSPKYKIFDVTQFGAIPNDGFSDKKAIEKAIRAAESNGSGIVFFPPGQFLINESSDIPTTIRLKSSRIIFRGSGSEEGGTELFMKNKSVAEDTANMWTGLPMFEFGEYKISKEVGKLSKNAKEGDTQIEFEKHPSIKPGQWVVLSLNAYDTNLIKQEIGNHTIDQRWTTMLKDEGVIVRMYYQVKKVKGNQIELLSPIGFDMDIKHPWKILQYNPLEEIGVENIAFRGTFTHPFVHHRSWVDDSGWNMFHFNGVVNSWMKDCRFTDVSIGVMVKNSAQVSVLGSKVTGNGTHEAIQSNRSTNVFIGKCSDNAGMFHSIGVDGWNMNTVIWCCNYTSTTSFESHSYQPRNTLLDLMEGGLLPNRAGGNVVNHPNHMRGLVLWNFKRIDSAKTLVDFWPETQIYSGRIVAPIIVGLHGKTTNFIDAQLRLLLSNGQKVSTESLYEYQLKRRLGFLPNWLKAYK
jgi:hypothetical protein